ncbi:MAG: hypothetical protein Q9177_004185 [Variospora cf. flavescens]
MANNEGSPRRNRPRKSPRMLRKVLSLPPVQDQIFGDESPGRLTWDDYRNLTPVIGPVLNQQGVSRERLDELFPPRCQEVRMNQNNQVYVCDEKQDENFDVRRCGGFRADAGTQKGHRNPNFPGEVQLRLLAPEHRVRTWDSPDEWVEHTRPSHFVCEFCLVPNHQARLRDWRNQWPHNSAHAPHLQRWFRLCKKHTLLGIAQGVHPDPHALALRPPLTCLCTVRDRPEMADSCDGCQREAQNPWDDRAQYWRRELLHTHKKRGGGRGRRTKKPRVDWTKAPRTRPVCPWNGCGEKAWYGTRDADRLGLSVCLACSSFVAV